MMRTKPSAIARRIVTTWLRKNREHLVGTMERTKNQIDVTSWDFDYPKTIGKTRRKQITDVLQEEFNNSPPYITVDTYKLVVKLELPLGKDEETTVVYQLPLRDLLMIAIRGEEDRSLRRLQNLLANMHAVAQLQIDSGNIGLLEYEPEEDPYTPRVAAPEDRTDPDVCRHPAWVMCADEVLRCSRCAQTPAEVVNRMNSET
jgi:hypothetical protein